MAANMMYTAVAGLNTFNEALSVVSDNIANANTTGFKSNTVDFGDLVSGLIATADAVPLRAQGVGSTILGVSTNFTTGSEIQTGTWSDLMIQGTGFFSVQNPTSSADSYTRDGSFEVNSSAYLTDMEGNEVLDSAGKTITIDRPEAPHTPVMPSTSIGKITGTITTGTTAIPIGQLGVTTFSNPNGLIRDGDNYYTPGANAGTVTIGAAGTPARQAR